VAWTSSPLNISLIDLLLEILSNGNSKKHTEDCRCCAVLKSDLQTALSNILHFVAKFAITHTQILHTVVASNNDRLFPQGLLLLQFNWYIDQVTFGTASYASLTDY
jgi:hypothetical protein